MASYYFVSSSLQRHLHCQFLRTSLISVTPSPLLSSPSTSPSPRSLTKMTSICMAESVPKKTSNNQQPSVGKELDFKNLRSLGLEDSDTGHTTNGTYSNAIHQFLEYPAVQKAFNSLKDNLKPVLLNMKNVSKDELTAKSGFETAAVIYLLKLFNASNPVLEGISKRARKGAMLLEEGEELVKEGKQMLKTAFNDIPNDIEQK